MTRPTADLLPAALALPAGERLAVAAELIASVDGPACQDWDDAWVEELDRRMGATTPTSDRESARARLLERLRVP